MTNETTQGEKDISAFNQLLTARREELRRACREEVLSDESSCFYVRKGRAEALIEALTAPYSVCAQWCKPLMLQKIQDIAADPFMGDAGRHLDSITSYVELAAEEYWEENKARECTFSELKSKLNKILENEKAMESLSLDYKRKLHEARLQISGEPQSLASKPTFIKTYSQVAGTYQSLEDNVALAWKMAELQCFLFDKVAQDESVDREILEVSLYALTQAYELAAESNKQLKAIEKAVSEKVEACWTQLKINELFTK
ncbi:hypothetical protein hmeg3_12965 [Herbaspirillum sp. meg3]|uniref:hypothetical protein n=1 Tax=Herbaspirillum sp. meg3 TaxID=2025949 RepID=UPI000B98E38B|nr:hypothetical protein [Herbaspirillum sp. meg3]ASU39106.1 hypothetical protein hmeg3_12965 [Herbaspirillum sp. meg3]